jgi:alkanesulfonate monooxygenase SsuD/methylene tetrahydromethanopterin reductase-like flavin-dependent oxidoreductase (luciferase family)
VTTSSIEPKISNLADRGMILGLRLGGLGEGADLAEQAGVDFVLLGDPSGAMEGPVGADPLSVAAFLMTTTKHIGLVACVADDWAPFNVARALASFDLLSGGRCGWVALRAANAEAARSEEHLDVVLQLFDSWEDEALVFDKAEAVFADRTKVHRIRHSGAFYTVDGPLNAPRPPQGRPVLFQPIATASDAADIVLVSLKGLGPESRRHAGLSKVVAEATVDLGGASGDSPAALAERLACAYIDDLCDGFLFSPTDPAVDIPLLVGEVIPALQARGIAARGYGEGDFRTRLGLARPANRFAGQVGP